MMNGAEYYDYLVTAYTNAGNLDDQYWLQPYLRDRNFDWWDYATQNALTQNYNINYTYGNNKSVHIFRVTTTRKKVPSRGTIMTALLCVPTRNIW